MKGIDISSFQGVVDFEAVKDAEVGFVLCKATEGIDWRDATFTRNWGESGKVGLRHGAYHFARPDLGNIAGDEARYFVSQLPSLTKEDILALDYEVNWGGDVVTWCLQWLDAVLLLTGKSPYIYLNLYLVKKYNWKEVVDAGFPLWLAYYDGDPTYAIATPWGLSPSIKQYTSTGTISGILPRVDVNEMKEVAVPTEIEQLRADFEEYKENVRSTVEAMKKKYDRLYHHIHTPAPAVPTFLDERDKEVTPT